MAKENDVTILLWAIFSNNLELAKECIDSGSNIENVIKTVKSGKFTLTNTATYEYVKNELRRQKLKKLL